MQPIRASAREPGRPVLTGDRPAVGGANGLVSIIVTCCGQLEFTRLCVPRLLRHNRSPFELLFVDAGSLDGTAEFLAGVAAAAPLPVEVITTAAEAALSEAYQEAVTRARGNYLVVLTNDTLVTADWLTHLVTLADQLATIGMVGPMANYAPPAQAVGSVPYRIKKQKAAQPLGEPPADGVLLGLEAVDQFAHDCHEQHRGQWSEVDHLGGFCLLLKRDVLDAVDLFATGSGLGFFGLDALSERARRAGFVLACCCDVYVHHFGTRHMARRKDGAQEPVAANLAGFGPR
jgi:GT2 family glycosyltransferase